MRRSVQFFWDRKQNRKQSTREQGAVQFIRKDAIAKGSDCENADKFHPNGPCPSQKIDKSFREITIDKTSK
jgi:hypothetical protein